MGLWGGWAPEGPSVKGFILKVVLLGRGGTFRREAFGSLGAWP
jgi:hypothetical protein